MIDRMTTYTKTSKTVCVAELPKRQPLLKTIPC